MKQAINKSKFFFCKGLPAIRPGEIIDYKNINLLCRFINEQGRILFKQMNRLTSKQQHLMTIVIKRARVLALLPFLNNEN
jgi:small subunit ribosomal protein S18